MNEAPVVDALATRLEQARQQIAKEGRVIVAFSGGVDSTLVLKLAIDALGPANVLAATGVSPSLAARELSDVNAIARQLGATLELIQTAEMERAEYVANPANRCYFCKTELYSRLSALARSRGFRAILNGTNADDRGDWRPGLKAADEWAVRSPLLEGEFTKADVRESAKALGLSNAQKPASPCLSSRIPYGTPVTPETLTRIERAENTLHDLGFDHFRVRHHDALARIEVMLDDLPRLCAEPLRSEVLTRFRAIGYAHVAVDLAGFRSGSGNIGLQILP